MKRTLRLAQWAAIATGILLLFWVVATVGGWSPGIKRLTSSVHGLLVGDYRAESPQMLAPLSSAITQDASRDQANAGRKRPGPTPSGGPSPSGSPTPSGSSIIPTVPPVSTPTVPVGTPTLPVPTPPPTPTLPTPPPLP